MVDFRYVATVSEDIGEHEKAGENREGEVREAEGVSGANGSFCGGSQREDKDGEERDYGGEYEDRD